MLNILTEPLIRMDTSGGSRVEASLPEVYAALMADQVDAFPALRPHQRHAWHAFLVQLGAMAMHKAGVSDPPTNATEWADLIRGLTQNFPDDEPWQLVVDDITKPAFMQPPASSWEKYNEKELFWTPDAVDMLDTARNHDLKNSVAMTYHPQDWLYALITMQTMHGQVGRGNYPIARMNSGDGSRTAFSITPSLRPGAHIRRDLIFMLERATDIVKAIPYKWDGIALLWIKQWDGEKNAISLSGLHPFHIEICRRRRLCVSANGRLYAMKAASAGRRIGAAKQLRGAVGDPWTLVTSDKKGDKALTLQVDSFNYKKITDYLTLPDWKLPALFSPTSEERNAPVVHLVMRGVRRTQGGQTERYHERIIPFRQRTVQVFGRPAAAKELGDIAGERIKQIGRVQNILRQAIATFACHGDAKKTKELLLVRKREDPLRKRVDELADKAEERIDERFFEHLQEEFEAREDERKSIRHDWLRNFVVPSAEFVLTLAHQSLPSRQNEFFYALASSQNLFDGSIHTAFPTIKGKRMTSRSFNLEREFTRAVIELAQEYNWEPFHIPARVYQNEWLAPGFPDLVLRYSDNLGRITMIAAELKTDDDENSVVTDHQLAFLKAFAQHMPTFVFRYRDWDYINDILRDGPPDITGDIIQPSRPVVRTKQWLPPDKTVIAVVPKIVLDVGDPFFPRGSLAELRRMNPGSPGKPSSFWQIMAERGLEYDEVSENLWALVIHGIALMTPFAHDSKTPVGKALFEGGDPTRNNPFYSKLRLNRLLNARGQTSRTLLSQLFRMMKVAQQPFDWTEMAKFVLHQERDPPKADKIRNDIARSYYRSQYHAERTSSQN